MPHTKLWRALVHSYPPVTTDVYEPARPNFRAGSIGPLLPDCRHQFPQLEQPPPDDHVGRLPELVAQPVLVITAIPKTVINQAQLVLFITDSIQEI